MISLGESNDSLCSKLKKWGMSSPEEIYNDKADEGKNGRCTWFKNGLMVIKFKGVYLSHSLIAHEVLHATLFIMEHIGIKLCSKSDEAYTYLHGYIIGELYKKLEQDGRKIYNQ
jgi:hypothetical protein